MPPKMLTRRSVLRSLPALSLLPRAHYAHAAAPRSRLLIGTGTAQGSNSKGIYLADWNSSTGALGGFTLAAALESPTFLALAPRSHRLYAISQVPDGHVTGFALRDRGDALSLDRINAQSAEGAGPAHISLSGESLFVSNYGGGSLTSYKISASGAISGVVSHVQSTAVDDLPVHAHPHIHEATPTPGGRWLLVNDLGSDRIWIYKIDPATAALTPSEPAFWQGRIKSGPRHLVFHPNGRWVYNVNELDSTVDHLLWNPKQGTLTTIGASVSTLAAGFPKDTAFASEIIPSPDGRFVYVGNRRNETIAKLDVNPVSGQLTLSQLLPHGGRSARHITLDPSGRFLLVACQDSGAIVVLARDLTTGCLSEPIHTYPIDSPQCLIFAT
jgi:6-phosphogluconolactonase